jgi:peptidoglycan/LPS O-acetylase OafA/YrhL
MKREDRLPQLDALRGLAALSVFLFHAFCMMPKTPGVLQWIKVTPLRAFCDGPSAVMLFFVLSGFVLNLKYVSLRTNPPHWVASFIIRRVFRIYPAFIIAMIFGLFLKVFVYDASAMSPFSDWFSEFWKDPLDPIQFLKMLTLVAHNIHTVQLDPPMWSLVCEMRVSLFFPVIIFSVNRPRKPLGDVCLIAVTYAVCFGLCGKPIFSYLPHFVLGAMCAKHFERIRPWLSEMGRVKKTGWLIVVIGLYQAASICSSWSPPAPYVNYFNYAVYQIVGMSAAGLMLATASFSRIGALLNKTIFRFIGRTSYSFYLVHLMLLIAPAPLIYRATGSYAITWLAAMILAYGISWAIFEWVELPMIKQGNKFSNLFCARPAPAGSKIRIAPCGEDAGR